jgi:hypothetical protein
MEDTLMEGQTSYIISRTIFPVEFFCQLFKKSEIFSLKELNGGNIEILFNRNKLLTGRDPALVVKTLNNLGKLANSEIVLVALANYLEESYVEWGVNFYNSTFPYAMLVYGYLIGSSLWKKTYLETVSNTALLALGFMLNYIYKDSLNSGVKNHISVLAEKLNRLIERGAKENSEALLPSEANEKRSLAVEVENDLERSLTAIKVSNAAFFSKPKTAYVEKEANSDDNLDFDKDKTYEGVACLLGNR